MQRRHMGVHILVGGMEHELIFPYIGNNTITPTDFHSMIFQRGRRKTTNQMHLFGRHCGSSGSSQLAKMPPWKTWKTTPTGPSKSSLLFRAIFNLQLISSFQECPHHISSFFCHFIAKFQDLHLFFHQKYP